MVETEDEPPRPLEEEEKEEEDEENPLSLKYWAPEHSPIAWLVINANVLIYSILLFVMVSWGGPPRFVDLVKGSYLWYDFITTVIWTLEALLREWSSRTSHRRELLAIRIELALAVYFAGSTAVSLYNFRFRTHKIEVVAFNVVINILAYGYMVYETSGMAVAYVLRELEIVTEEAEAEGEAKANTADATTSGENSPLLV